MNEYLPVSVIQTILHWEDKKQNLEMLEEKIASIPGKMGIVVLPEMFSTGFSMNPKQLAEDIDGETLNWMKRMAGKYKIILTGSLMIRERNQNTGEEEYFNRLIWMLPNGGFGQYNKRHLFAFAGEDQHYSSGSNRLIASVSGWRFNLQVCYDLRFPVWARQSASETPEYDVLVYVANWPEKRSHAWKTLLQARAIENQCYVIGANRVGKDGNDISYAGDSMIIDPVGEVLHHAADEEEVFTIILDKNKLNEVRERFPFWKDADRFMIGNEEG